MLDINMESTQLHARPSSELMKIVRTVSASREALLGDGARSLLHSMGRSQDPSHDWGCARQLDASDIPTINLATSLSSASPDRPFVCVCIIWHLPWARQRSMHSDRGALGWIQPIWLRKLLPLLSLLSFLSISTNLPVPVNLTESYS